MLRFSFVVTLLTAGIALAAAAPVQPVQAIPSLDLDRYLGRWYEIARYPNRFQKQCASDVTAEYARLPDGRIRVINACRQAGGTIDQAEGVARLAEPGGAASKLKVRFAPAFLSFISAVWGDYWVIGLAPDYSYAVVGDPGRHYLWVLSRTPALDDETYAKALESAIANGFDPARLVKTRQAHQ